MHKKAPALRTRGQRLGRPLLEGQQDELTEEGWPRKPPLFCDCRQGRLEALASAGLPKMVPRSCQRRAAAASGGFEWN